MFLTLKPYKRNNLWVFDDSRYGISNESFVCGADIMMEILSNRISNGKNGFKLIISDEFFEPSFVLEWLESRDGGERYYWYDEDLPVWFCPTFYNYFKTPPNFIYLKAEPYIIKLY